jgi:hypothetical protein
VGLDIIVDNNDGVIVYSIPSLTLGDGATNLPANETVLLSLSGAAFEDATTGASLGSSYIPSVS